jgi:hypothetical protein
MAKRKKLRMTSTGRSKVHVNDLGGSRLKNHHGIGIAKFEKGNAGRAVVYDQHLIDILYKNKDFDEKQHRVCNVYLGVIAKSLQMTSPPFGERLSTGKYYIAPVPRSCILIKVQRYIRKNCGSEVENRFWILMIYSPRQPKKIDIRLMRQCANALLGFYYVSDDSPVSLFRQALASPLF